jgi:predicted GNAT superfamily acetyltransferase
VRWPGLERESVLALNHAHEIETSPLDAAAHDAMLGSAFHADAVDGGRDAFLIAFDEGAAYASPNFLWLKRRLSRFVYVDRVVVAAHARGQGLAASLYGEVFRRTRDSGRTIIACEVNLAPPNPASDAFHARLGFGEIGQVGAPGEKRVRYLARVV